MHLGCTGRLLFRETSPWQFELFKARKSPGCFQNSRVSWVVFVNIRFVADIRNASWQQGRQILHRLSVAKLSEEELPV